MQTTLKTGFSLFGTGLHNGLPVSLRALPGKPNTGIVFKRIDLPRRMQIIPAHQDMVKRSPLCTLLENTSGGSVSTVEHLMAAFAGCGIDNAVVEIDGPEIPIMDGSSLPFVTKIRASGLQYLPALRKVLTIVSPIRVSLGDSWAELLPGHGFQMDVEIDFQDQAIGRQFLHYKHDEFSFDCALAASRTFCRNSDLGAMHAAGKALGGSLENAVVVDGDKILNPTGLRMADEFVRHKALDAIGDLALLGHTIEGRYRSYKPGHALNNLLARAAMDALSPNACGKEIQMSFVAA